MIHQIKLVQPYVDAVYKGFKTFEVRKNDRHYKIGDLVDFIPVMKTKEGEIIPIKHPITNKRYVISYVLNGGDYGIDKDYVVFAIRPHSNK